MSTDLKQRLHYHNSGLISSIKLYVPAMLQSYIAVETETIAINLEKYFWIWQSLYLQASMVNLFGFCDITSPTSI